MSIQQSVNQLLGTAGIAAGLYAHQPNVQKKRADAADYERLNQEYQPGSMTTEIGREGIKAEKGLTDAGLEPEEAAVKALEYTEKDLANIKRLAELEKDPKRKGELYEAAGFTQGYIDYVGEEYQEFKQKQAQIEQEKRDKVQAAADEKQRIEAIRNMIMEDAPQVQTTPREVIRYGK